MLLRRGVTCWLVGDRTGSNCAVALRTKSRTGDSGCDAMIIVQHSAQTSAALHRARVREMNWVRLNQPVVQTLMVPLAMVMSHEVLVMSHEVLNGCPQRTFPKEDQPFQTGLLDAAHAALRMARLDSGSAPAVSLKRRP